MEQKDKNNRSVSDGELDLLKVMWEQGRLKVSELRDYPMPPADIPLIPILRDLL